MPTPMTWFACLLISLLLAAGTAESQEQSASEADQLLDSAYENFRSGNTTESRSAADKALALGLEQENTGIVGRALTALCRLALRDNDAARLDELTGRLAELAEDSGDQRWRVYGIHMQAEMARMNKRLDAADDLYVESLELSQEIGLTGMVAAENFNRSFIAVARGDFDAASAQVGNYFRISADSSDGEPGAYGLIALANLLAARDDLVGAAVVNYSTERIFSELNIIPDPADAAPLKAVADRVLRELSEAELSEARALSEGQSVRSLIARYLADAG